ncbi:MAG: hypothetical protein CMH57_04255 [Myxococcales bacterium]|nr:hypothetical protein [Myxococcales bacterium]
MSESSERAIGVVGQGPWMKMLVDLARTHGRRVVLWAAGDVEADDLGDLSGVTVAADAELLCESSRTILMATTFPELPSICERLGEHVQGHHQVVHTLQGMEPGTGRFATEIITELTCVRQVGALVGPIYPDMYLEGKPCGAIIGSEFPQVIDHLQGWLTSPRLRLYGSRDLAGVETAAAAVRPIAAAFGLASVLELGPSARGMLMARGVAEVARLVEAFGGNARTAFGMAGLGSLATQVEPPGASAYQIGEMLARGESLEAIVEAHGARARDLIETSRQLSARAEEDGVASHIVGALARMFSGELSAPAAMRELFALRQMME